MIVYWLVDREIWSDVYSEEMIEDWIDDSRDEENK